MTGKIKLNQGDVSAEQLRLNKEIQRNGCGCSVVVGATLGSPEFSGFTYDWYVDPSCRKHKMSSFGLPDDLGDPDWIV